jgi:hypothetical protein
MPESKVVMAAANEACSTKPLTPANLRYPTTMYLTPHPDDKRLQPLFRWTKLRTTRSLTMADIEDMLIFIVDNTFSKLEMVRHQVMGPHGHKCSPEIANYPILG